MPVKPLEQWQDVRAIGVGGWNSFDDATQIGDNQLSDVENMSYDSGILQLREGSHLLYEKPEVESGTPLQIITTKTSDGVEYVIAIYDNHFYVRHEDNEEWLRINSSYVPTETDLFYGWVNWNNGRGDDRLYFCNGVDNMGRWDMCVTEASGAQLAGAATFTVADGTRFPTTGTLVISGASSVFTEAYTNRVGNVFTLTNTLNQNVADGASVSKEVIDKSAMEIGKVLQKNQQRLFVMNYYGGEIAGFYSVLNDPEDFTVSGDIGDGSSFVISDGNGEITGAHDFGQFLVIEKGDSLHSFSLKISDDLGSKLDVIQPIVSGDSIGPLSMVNTAKVMNKLYYPTRSNGFLSVEPTSTGTQVSVDVQPLSEPIDNYVSSELDLEPSIVVANDNKVAWAVARSGGIQNTLVIVYDILRKAWTRHSGFAVQSFSTKDSSIIFLDGSNGNIYEIFDGGYSDSNNPYLAQAYTKRFDFGVLSVPKSEGLIYVQGYMTIASEFFIDVLFNEGGLLNTQTFQINKDTENLYFSDEITDAQGQFILGQSMLGGVSLSRIGNLSFFRCYLGISLDHVPYNIQCRIYSNKAAFYGISGMSFNPDKEQAVPQNYIIQPIEE